MFDELWKMFLFIEKGTYSWLPGYIISDNSDDINITKWRLCRGRNYLHTLP